MLTEMISGENEHLMIVGLPEETFDEASETTAIAEVSPHTPPEAEVTASNAGENFIVLGATVGTMAALAVVGRFQEKWADDNPLPHEQQ